MKVLLFSEGMKIISKSGVGKAIKHQMKALEVTGIQYSIDKNDENYDIVHINTVGPFSYYLAKKAHSLGKKVIVHAHSTEEDFRNSFFFSNWISPMFKKWLIHAYTQADELITPTPYSKSLLKNYSIQIPINVVSNGIDLCQFGKDIELGKLFRKKYQFQESEKLILSVGLHIERKGILDFVALAEELPEYQFVWCGYTNPYLLSMRVNRIIKKHPQNVHFLGYIDDMRGPYSACDIFFMPTYEENEGIVVLEALASMLPIIIRDIPVYEDWLEHNINCYKGASNNEFKQIITDVFNRKLNSLADNGMKVVEDRSIEKVGLQLSSIYTRLMKEA